MIYLIGEIEQEMTEALFRRLDKNPKRANFMLCSMGGSLAEGFAMYDRIKILKESTVTATGICASAATVVLQAAKIRRATPNAQFMFHLVQFDNLEDNKIFKPHFDSLVCQLFVNRGLTITNYLTAVSKKVFGVKEALSLGIIDEIWDGKNAKSGLS